jgi:hypothetical protein
MVVEITKRELQVLEDEFPGEKAWTNFYNVFADNWLLMQNKDDYLKVIPEESIAAVIAVKMGSRGLSWFSTPANALDGKSPQQVFLSGPVGAIAIKTLIMRMP